MTLIVGGAATFSYDDNGNLIGGSTLSGVYDHANLPWSVQRAGAGGGFDRFAYGPDGQRTWHLDSAGVQTWYGEAGYEKVRRGGVVEHRHALPGTIITVKQGQTEITHTHGDRLGSIVLMTDSDGVVKRDGQGQEMRRSYDAFGLVRQGNLSNRPGGTLNLDPPQNRGFTGHEHLDTTRLIHMNGRTYDPILGRFMGVDPIIQAPANSQSLNPYSYIMNNPLAGLDPTGYVSCGDVMISDGGKGSCDHELDDGEIVSVDYNITSRRINISASPSTFNAIMLNNEARAQTAEGVHREDTSGGGRNLSEIGSNHQSLTASPHQQNSRVLRQSGSNGNTVPDNSLPGPDPDQAELVKTSQSGFRDQRYEYCAYICGNPNRAAVGPDRFRLGSIHTDRSRITCDVTKSSCPAGWQPVADIHNHPGKPGSFNINPREAAAAGISINSRGPTSVTLTEEGLNSFSGDDTKWNRQDQLDGWLIPRDSTKILWFPWTNPDQTHLELPSR